MSFPDNSASPCDLPPPRAVYIAFEAFPRPKGSASHMGAMLKALTLTHAPVWLLCCGFADMPALQFEGDLVIHRHKYHHPNMLHRADDFGRFVYDKLAGLPCEPEICVYRDPWGGAPASSALRESRLVFEVNALPSWELPYTHPAVVTNHALRTKIEETERFCLSMADGVIIVSDLTGRLLEKSGYPGERIHLIPNSADDHFFDAGGNGADLPQLDEGRWFGYVGSLHPWQGIEVLLDAWARVEKRYPDVTLLLVHNGKRAPLKPIRKKIRKRNLVQRVYIQSPVEPGRLAHALTRMEFTTAPLMETFRNTVQGCCPIKIVESMAAGAPVVASDIAVNRALIRHGHDGFLTTPGNVRDWALALDTLLGDSTLRSKLSEGAVNTARSDFTRTRMLNDLKNVFLS